LCTLLSIKTGACPEDCAYCPQSGHYQTGVKREKLLPLENVIALAQQAKDQGATRFCMGAAWRGPSKKDLPAVINMITAVKKIGLETCVTLGMLDADAAQQLKVAGLDFYNHNLDTSPEYYPQIISTHTYQDRLDTLQHVQNADLRVCCGGIIGMGESRRDRAALLSQLANLPQQPESIPINRLIPIPGTPLEGTDNIDNFEFIRTIAITRIMMPKAMIRLSAGRMSMSEETQALCFLAGANSMWLGDKLLTTQNPDHDKDTHLLAKLGMKPKRCEN
jgi:biotin synthase